MDIKILIAAHKPYWMPDDDVYFPLHVGKAGKESIGFQGDDTGDNISEKNPSFCELTGLYWAWKNFSCEYLGLCHYRRYFGKGGFASSPDERKLKILHREDYETLLQEYEVLLPKKRNYYIETVRSQYEHAHHKKDLDAVEQIVKEMAPEYSDAFTKVMDSKKLHILNMFVMKKRLFDEYCGWLFPILFELEKRTDISEYSMYDQRLYGFLSERLFNVWLLKRQPKAKELPVICLEKTDWVKKINNFIKRKFSQAHK